MGKSRMRKNVRATSSAPYLPDRKLYCTSNSIATSSGRLSISFSIIVSFFAKASRILWASPSGASRSSAASCAFSGRFASTIISLRASDQPANSAGAIDTAAREKSRTLICDSTWVRTSGRIDSYSDEESLTRPSAAAQKRGENSQRNNNLLTSPARRCLW